MPYNTDILNRLDQLCDSQSELLANFTAIAALLQQDHVNFNGADQGKHKKLTMPIQTSAAPTPSSNEYEMICGQRTIGDVLIQNLLGFQAPGVSTLNATASYATATYRGVGVSTGQTLRLPSGVLIKWAFFNNVHIESGDNTGLQKITWTTAGSNELFTNQRWAYVTPVRVVNSDSDVNVFFYVYDLTDPTQLKFLSFTKNPPIGVFPIPVRSYTGGLFALAIGD